MPAQGTAPQCVLARKPTSNGWFGRACYRANPGFLRDDLITMQKIYLQTLATACTVVALATSACGSSDAGAPGPIPSPITADSVRAAFDNSKMKSAHFKVQGTLIKKPGYYPVTGDGVFQLVPREALQTNLRVQTYTSAGVLKIQEVNIVGRLYTRVGTGRWTSKASSDSPMTLTSYVGEETLAGTTVWHARSVTAHSTYDVWVRESDGYIVQLALAQANSNLTMTFDSCNKSPAIAIPR